MRTAVSCVMSQQSTKTHSCVLFLTTKVFVSGSAIIVYYGKTVITVIVILLFCVRRKSVVRHNIISKYYYLAVEAIYGSVPEDLNKKGLEGGLPILGLDTYTTESMGIL